MKDLLVNYNKLSQPPARPTMIELGFSLISFDFIVSSLALRGGGREELVTTR